MSEEFCNVLPKYSREEQYKLDKEEFYKLWNSIERKNKDKLLDVLENHSDYFTAPASTQYHSSYKGGLLHHSINVYKKLKMLIENNKLWFIDKDSPIVIALLHDLCKINCYKVEYRNTKDENGKWVQKPYYKFEDGCGLGVHGDRSVMLAQMFGFPLSAEEIACIRFHMGAYESREVIPSLGVAKRKYDNVIWVCLADELATLQEERGF